MQIKVCGITRHEDALAAASMGVDAIGFVLWSGSKRGVTVADAVRLCEGLPPFLTLTALLVNPSATLVEDVLSHLPVNLLQFHGDEKPEFCERWHFPYIRALKAVPGANLVEQAEGYPGARGFLLDSVHQGQFGGTGQAFDWTLVPEDLGRPLILAGGLNAANVGQGIQRLRPAAVDVSSGVESAPGVKDHEKIQRFVEAVRTAQKRQQS